MRVTVLPIFSFPEFSGLKFLSDPRNADEGMTAGPTEYVGKDWFLGGFIRHENPWFEGDEAVLVLIECGINGPRLRNKLV